MQPPVISLRGNCRSWRLPPPAQNAQSPLPALVLPSSPSHLSQIRRLDQLLPPLGNLRPQNRSDAAGSGHAAASSILLVAHQKTGGRAQDVFLLLTPHLWTKKRWWRAVAPGAVTIATRQLQGTRRSSTSTTCCSNPIPSTGSGDT
ncbi:uncharacterized protein [Lolium perenne]|uniref:uncharacterized protein n=1 Tax=Lolium perenne TaxID=4522 RepID=UPI003A992B00